MGSSVQACSTNEKKIIPSVGISDSQLLIFRVNLKIPKVAMTTENKEFVLYKGL